MTGRTLTKQQQKQIESMFHGTSKTKAIKNGRKIAETLGISRRLVMEHLMDKGLAHYSTSSYL